MPEMTLSEAAKWTGKQRSTVFKAIKSGRISARKDDKGHILIDPAELERVFRPAGSDEPGNVSDNSQSEHTDMAVLRAENALLRQMADKAEERASELAQDRDHWRQQAEAQTRLLTHEQQKPKPGNGWKWPWKRGN